ncbi:uncharacterized protein MKK02DRAFT_44244 [Dioszegia hungarica]|uniref:Uncharacterized protein n=1 Tax=Dioszegia hungarica TaxID=4972 RepID=A0AA38H9W9_9TREE|nr:uncharacterized protein MKK02DRAFT_44244 [Dioszegia hungarica]KAI9635554.1 hypothetical protein MKK02DRAFT_44244 [Dioszegia hungarica]
MVHPLHGLSQAIHQDHLSPPCKFFLYSTIVPHSIDTLGEVWEVRLYATVGGELELWVSTIGMNELPAEGNVLAEAIKGGMLHVVLKGKQGLQKETKLELQFLRAEEQPITIRLEPEEDESGGTELLEAAFSLLNWKPTGGGSSDKAELRSLRNQIAKKDAEISELQTKVISLKSTVLRAATEENKKKALVSPKKPVGASTLQPNAKRRKAVADEFAGSDSD